MSNSINMFNIGKSGLMVSKQAMTTTSHNIANVNSEGFSRQEVQQTASRVVGTGKLAFGTGAWAKKITRASDEYLERRIQGETKNFGNVEEKDIYLQQSEQIFNESSNDGLNRLATRFFNEFRKLSADPSDTSLRASVREATKQLTGDINRMDREMKEVSKNIDTKVESYVHEVNSLAKEVRDLNLLIERTEIDGGFAPDLHDQRDLSLKKLGSLADISTSTDNNGRVSVTLNGLVAIVAGESLTELDVSRTPADPATGKRQGNYDVIVKGPVNEVITGKLRSGRLGGLLEVRDEDLRKASEKLDKVAFIIAKEMNTLHRQGVGLDGATGRNFFEDPMGKEGAAERLKIAKDIDGNLDAIAAAKDPNSPSDNRIAIAMSAIGDMKGLADDFNSSILDVYNGMVSELGTKTEATKKSLIFHKDVLSQLENVRESLVGVNLDEETANLVRFQHAYQANAKVLQVADELITGVLNAFKG